MQTQVVGVVVREHLAKNIRGSRFCGIDRFAARVTLRKEVRKVIALRLIVKDKARKIIGRYSQLDDVSLVYHRRLPGLFAIR